MESNSKNSKHRFEIVCIVIILIILVAFLSSFFTYRYIIKNYGLESYSDFYRDTAKLEIDEGTTLAVDTISDITDWLDVFSEFIDEKYYGEINKEDMINATIKGFVNGIGDEYSEYMTAEEWEEYQLSALGNYSGIGIYMSIDDDLGYPIVVQVIEGSPAESAGLKTEDILTAVDGESLYGLSLDEASSSVKGENGTDVTVTVYRNDEYIDFTITREEIKVYHVQYELMDDNIGYVQFITFDEGLADEFEDAVDDLLSQGATKFILDLRYNTGGIVDEALSIIDLFLDKDEVELIQVSKTEDEVITKAELEKKYDFDLVLLVNEYTASASEILTGALVDYDLATTIGTQTYGKGVIQNVYPLTTGGVLKLTTAEYYTPNRNEINKVGITPDIEVELETETNDDGEEETIDTQLNKAIEYLTKK